MSMQITEAIFSGRLVLSAQRRSSVKSGGAQERSGDIVVSMDIIAPTG